MRVFMTGASGWIGSAVTAELVAAGHQVVGLARSDASAAAVAALGAEAHRGSIDEPDGLAAVAKASDGVVHLAYNHDFSRMGDAAATDRRAIEVFGAALAGSDRPLLFASGVVGLAPGRTGTELDDPDPAMHPRVGNGRVALSFAERGVRPVAVRFAPTVHGDGDHGFIAVLVGIARAKGVSAYVEDGGNRWPAVHRLDAARLVRLTLEDAAGSDPVAGTAVHAVGEEGVPTRDIAAAIGAGLGLPVVSLPRAEVDEHFGWIGRFFGMDAPASNALTRERLGWTPAGPGLLEDLEQGHYFRST